MKELISIIIPVYNHRAELRKCLASLTKQIYQNFEVIVIDDNSKEDIKTVVPDKIGQNEVKYIKIVHGGASKARNYGFQISKGSYLLFLDADIVCKPQMLEKMINTLKRQIMASYAYSSFKYGWKTFKLWPFDQEKLKKMNYIHTSSLIRREHFPGFSAKGRPTSGWDESLKRFQDWDLWLTMLKQGRIGVWVPEILFEIKNIHRGTISSWLPKFIYKIPWLKLKQIKKYKEAQMIIKQKHNL